MRLQGKVAVVTGGGFGFGEGMVERFVAEGANVVVADVDQENGARVAEAHAGAVFQRTDVSVSADVAAMVARAEDEFGGLDILVNNAGIAQRNRPMLEVGEAEFERLFAVNVKSIYLGAVHGVPALRRRGGGVIINTASTAALRPRPGLTWYNGTKGAVVTLTKSMAVELAPDGIRVNALNPVVGETGLTVEFMGGVDTPEIREQFVASIPLGRMATPADVASAALYLASDDAQFITGTCLQVDGGRGV